MATKSWDETSWTGWNLLSVFVGWSYVVVWSISFYPQAYLNWKRKSVRGLSIDFLFYNVLGFFCYSAYSLALYFDDEIRDEYHQRHPSSRNSLVRLNDVVFSVHGFLLSLLILLQTCVYRKQARQHISSFAAAFVWLTMLISVLVLATIHYGGATSLDFLYFLSTVTLIVSFIKYLPQVWVNYKRQSTQGWSIQYISWDLAGGLLSIVQLLIDAYLDGDWTGIEGDNVKLGLGSIVVCYDALFMIQHYILYPKQISKHPIRDERKRLIEQCQLSRSDFKAIVEDDSNDASPSTAGSRLPINTRQAYGSTQYEFMPFSSSV
ncbi:PQ loop repeat-domain-containing protein [Choanephora cucurbitarum]|nr:PQ loop repeat-domain-containing protein [Choanephora cucurbitarum]